jgi:hypothetical protein
MQGWFFFQITSSGACSDAGGGETTGIHNSWEVIFMSTRDANWERDV